MKAKQLLLTLLILLSFFKLNAQIQIWGMTSGGGQFNNGTIFKTDNSGNNQTVQQSFSTTDGSYPYGSLMQASDGKLYGMTINGGANNKGVLFQHDPTTNTYIKKLDFAGATNGSYADGSLIQALDGKLYGMTRGGGVNNKGVLFQYEPATNTYNKKLDFAGTTNGSSPDGSLMQASDGKLYGMTKFGGTNDKGVLFQYEPATNTYTKKIDFDGTTNGSYPNGSLMQASDGKLYGMTHDGGANNKGVLFQYYPATNTYTKKFDFDGTTNGSSPDGSLMQASDGKLYGMTYYGGANDKGVLFQYEPATNTYTKKLDFDGTTNGSYPDGSLMQASDGKLYGITYYGGANNKGVLFQYYPTTNTFTKQLDFNGINGSNPMGNLIEINATSVGIHERQLNKSTLFIYPNPANEKIVVEYYSEESKQMNVELFDLLGNRLCSVPVAPSLGENKIQLNLTGVAEGIYLVKAGDSVQKIQVVK